CAMASVTRSICMSAISSQDRLTAGHEDCAVTRAVPVSSARAGEADKTPPLGGCVVEVFACDGTREVAADHGHVDRVLLQVSPHHDFLVEGARADDGIGRCRAVPVDIAVVPIAS